MPKHDDEIVNKVKDLEEKVKEVHNQAFVDEDGYLAVKCGHCDKAHRIMLWGKEIKVRESESYKFCIQTVSP